MRFHGYCAKITIAFPGWLMADIQKFGGDWTQEKLARVKSYLAAYTTVLKKQPFKLIYIDAFAGTGYRNLKADDTKQLLFPDQIGEDAEKFHAGSARIALEVTPRFDEYHFIETDQTKCAELEKLKIDFPDKAKDIYIICEDANTAIQKECKTSWNKSNVRCVLFLDPFGMNVSWETIEAIAGTHNIDMWYLFPLGVGVNRLLKKDGNIFPTWKKKLDDIFGSSEWENLFYKTESIQNLFGEEEVTTKTGDFKQIADYFVKRMETIFPGVIKKPLLLCNAKNNPLYMLCFACGNKNGSGIALKIAGHILKG
jgi:three-Cys-motif partner protein